MQRYMQEIPYLRSLYYVVKTIFDIRGLSDVFRGGFGSYSIFMMLVASLKHAPHQRQDAAGGLLNFLKFYSDFDAKAHGISIEPVELFDKVQHPVITNPVKISFKVRTPSVAAFASSQLGACVDTMSRTERPSPSPATCSAFAIRPTKRMTLAAKA